MKLKNLLTLVSSMVRVYSTTISINRQALVRLIWLCSRAQWMLRITSSANFSGYFKIWGLVEVTSKSILVKTTVGFLLRWQNLSLIATNFERIHAYCQTKLIHRLLRKSLKRRTDVQIIWAIRARGKCKKRMLENESSIKSKGNQFKKLVV